MDSNKKREIKARDKSVGKDQSAKKKSAASKVPGTVNFTYDPSRKKHSGDKKNTGGKKTGDKRPFKPNNSSGDKKKGYANRDGKPGSAGKDAAADKTHSQHRREKQKVSDLIKKLRINYNKLLMKKKELK